MYACAAIFGLAKMVFGWSEAHGAREHHTSVLLDTLEQFAMQKSFVVIGVSAARMGRLHESRRGVSVSTIVRSHRLLADCQTTGL